MDIDGREYVDGGAWSATNLDAAPAGRDTLVLCLDPIAGLPLRRRARAATRCAAPSWPAQLELQGLRARGARVRHVHPEGRVADLRAAICSTSARAERVLAAGYAQGLALGTRPGRPDAMVVVEFLVAIVLIVAGAIGFTNAVEWLGQRLELGASAVGALLAAVGTALPESTIPIVALIAGGGDAESVEVAIGAIIGAPFWLGTAAMLLIAGSAHRLPRPARARRARPGRPGHDAARPRAVPRRHALRRPARRARHVAGRADRRRGGARARLRWHTMRLVAGQSEAEAEEEDLEDLYIDTRRRTRRPRRRSRSSSSLSLGAIIFGAELFVRGVESIAESIGVAPLIISLVLAPLATELPEKANSVLWIREDKDVLAVGNVTGAMAFQGTIPVALGMILTDWHLEAAAVGAAVAGIAGGALALAFLPRGRLGHVPALGWTVLLGGFARLRLAHLSASVVAAAAPPTATATAAVVVAAAAAPPAAVVVGPGVVAAAAARAAAAVVRRRRGARGARRRAALVVVVRVVRRSLVVVLGVASSSPVAVGARSSPARNGRADRPMLSPEMALAARPIPVARPTPSTASAAIRAMVRSERSPIAQPSAATGSRGGAPAGPTADSGRRTSARAPPSGRLAIRASPPQRRASTRTMVRPSPLPRGRAARELPRKKRSKTRSSSPSASPGPASATAIEPQSRTTSTSSSTVVPARRVLERVLDQVVEHDRDVLGRGVDGGAGTAVVEDQLAAVLLDGDGAPALERAARGAVQGQRRDDGRALALAGQGEQVGDRAGEALGLAVGGVEVALQRLVLGLQAGRLEAQPQPGERRAQLVGGVGHEVALGDEGLPQALGHLVEGVGDLAVLGGPGLVGAGVEVAGGDAPRRLGQVAQRAGEVAGEQPGDDQAEQRGRPTPRPMRASVSRRTSASTASTDWVTRTAPVRLALVDDRHGGEEQVLAEVRAEARALGDAAGQRLGDLRPGRVGLLGRRGAGRVGEQVALRVDDDHAPADRARGGARDRVELGAALDPADRGGGDELGLVGRLGLDLGVDALGQVERERHLERDEHEHEDVGEGGQLPPAQAHGVPSPNRKPTPRTVWM